jgi:nitrate reductase gamma subunit
MTNVSGIDAESAATALTNAAAAVSNALTNGSTKAALDAVSHASQARLSFNLFDRLEYFVTVPLVYISILFLVAGIVYIIVKVFRSPKPPYTLKLFPAYKKPGLAGLADTFLMPQVRRFKPLFWFFLILFHISFILLILGHLDILPQINLVSPASRDMLGAGLVGLGVTIPLFYFLGRRFRTPVREISLPADYLLLALILFLSLFGDLMSWGNSWTQHGFVMTKLDFSKYFDGLVRFTFADPRTVLHGSHYHFIVIHVLLAELFFIILPFTKIMHSFFALPVNMLRRK